MYLPISERKMSTSSRGTPPTSPAVDPDLVKEIQKHSKDYVTRDQLATANNSKPKNEVRDAPSARAYLEASGLLVKGNPLVAKGGHFMRSEPFMTFMKLALLPQVVLGKVVNPLGALAYMGVEIDDEVAQEVAQTMVDTISLLLNTVVKNQEAMNVTMRGFQGESTIVSKAIEQLQVEVQALEVQVKELKIAVDGGCHGAAAAALMTVEQAGILVGTARMQHQILIDKASDAVTDSLSMLSELELKEKGNLALTIMTEKMERASFVGGQKLTNRGVIFVCKVKGTEVMWQFVAALGDTCVFMPRCVKLIIEMVPVETRIDNVGTWHVVEADSGMKEGDVLGARSVKVPQRRMNNQRVAHLKLEVGVFHKVCWCEKCQKLDGHLAHACKSAVDVCRDCPVTDSSIFKYLNCNMEGHGAVDQHCPVFLKEQQKRRARDPTADYRYFPTKELWTWVAVVAPHPQALSGGGAWVGRVGNGHLAGRHPGQGGGGPVDAGWPGSRTQQTIQDAFKHKQDGLSQRQHQAARGIVGHVGTQGPAAGTGEWGTVHEQPLPPVESLFSPATGATTQVPVGAMGGAQ
ncbi:hypothetical protein DFH07DRAFT_777492 [Mycena maculata]|uniref:Uncharacterized protein n=1 Tax=Mycena maculata TaxID=230809 RepID=A0AAD7IH71_9AGAR|nr:hypothetical protein DFH07DRAFT_777492 [Mycena maculata]